MDPQEREAWYREQERFFDRTVDLFDQPQPPEVIDRLKEIVRTAGIREGERIVDVGAGVGVLVPILDPYRPSRIVACDLSAGMLRRLQEKYPYVEPHQGDIRTLNLQEGSIDVIFMNAVFSNIPDKETALAKASSLLKKGGRLVISHPEGREFIRWLRERVPFPLDLLPTFPQLKGLIRDLPLKIARYIDQPKLYVAMAVRV